MPKQKTSSQTTHNSHALSRRKFLGQAAGLGAMATAGLFGVNQAHAQEKKLFLIGLEEHFTTPELQKLNARGDKGDKRLFSGGSRRPELLELGKGRIADMDAAGIDIQVLSAVTPGAQNLAGAKGIAFTQKFNAWVAEKVIAEHPERFRAFATLPLKEPAAAADELERSVRDYGFVGCMTYGPVDGKFLDHPDFESVLARAEALGVPIYIHPNWPSPQAKETYYDGFDNKLTGKILSGPGYGWHQEVALQCLRLITRGVFDKFPKLQVVVGHMGEGLPFYYWRVSEDLDRIANKHLKKPVQQYFHDNLWITTSAFFQDELLSLALATFGEDRIMFSVDYPMASANAGAAWLRATNLSRTVKEKIGHKNAEKLLGIKPLSEKS